MRININYNLDAKCVEWSKSVNREISKLSKNEIDFSSNLCRPHITLLMGEIEENNLEQIKKIVKDFKSTAINKEVNFGLPYIKGKYVFVEAKKVADFKSDCENLLKLLKDLIIPHRHSICNGNTPHITLGYAEDLSGATKFIDSIENVPKAFLEKISVDITGIHGTVLCES